MTHALRPAFAEFGIGGADSETLTEADFNEALRSKRVLAHLRGQVYRVTHLLTHFDDVEDATQAMVSDLAEELRSL